MKDLMGIVKGLTRSRKQIKKSCERFNKNFQRFNGIGNNCYGIVIEGNIR